MLFDFARISASDGYKLLVSTVTPRPIAWVVSQNSAGRLNAAPFSFFNALAGDPPIIGVSMGSHQPGHPKDSRNNIRETRQFVVNLVSEENAESMNVTAIEFDPSVNELLQARLETVPSLYVKTPRIAASPVAMECELMQIVDLGAYNGLVIGRVLAMHIRDEMVIDAAKCYVDTPKLKLIGRMHGAGWYARTSDLFQMARIPVKDWDQTAKASAELQK
jgi:flavin reductase (DIM6/NTAB) family NADH-FMN oxidoreductase RutF